MKTIHIAALAVLLALAACGADPKASTEAHDEAGSEHGEEGHEDEEAGHDEAGGKHEEAPSTVIPESIAEEAGIQVRGASGGVIADEHEVQGLLTPIEGRVAEVGARFPGVVRSVRANVGDTVAAGQTLATIHSNLNLTELWVDLHIFGADAEHIRAGAPVMVTRMGDGETLSTVIERVLPGMATASQSTIARATISNLDGLWRPGAAIKARITVEQQPVDLLVPLSALQTMDGQDVVFVREDETYTARPVELGSRDSQQAQVLSGLRAGEHVVVEESYLIKADIEKEGAEHAH